MDAVDASAQLAAEVSRKARDFVTQYTTIPATMCLLDGDGLITYAPIPELPTERCRLARVLQAAYDANAAGLAIAHVVRTKEEVPVDMLVVLAMAGETTHVEVTPFVHTFDDGITFQETISCPCDIVRSEAWPRCDALFASVLAVLYADEVLSVSENAMDLLAALAGVR